MDEVKYQELKDRYQKANGLRSRISKCKEAVASWSHLFDVALHGSNTQEFNKKKLDYWLIQLDKAKEAYAKF